MSSQVLIIAAASLTGLTIVALALLRAWRDWLALKRDELGHKPHLPDYEAQGGSTIGAARIEMADLKERIRKLEAIASGVDL